jgi:hypothetical protein
MVVDEKGIDTERTVVMAAETTHPRYAFPGVRPCDLRAIAIQDRMLAQPGSRYAARRTRLLIVAAFVRGLQIIGCSPHSTPRSPPSRDAASCPYAPR